MRNVRFFMFALLVALNFTIPRVLEAQSKPDAITQLIFDAMESELSRAKSKMKLEGFEPPYFISYTLKVQEGYSIEGSNGSIFSKTPLNKSSLAVIVRVGSYQFDNYDPERAGEIFPYSESSREFFELLDAPITIDKGSLLALRRRLWLLTDIAYKNSISAYLEKKAKSVQLLEAESIPDFSQEEPQTFIEPVKKFNFDVSRWEKIIAQEGAYLASFPDIRRHNISVKAYQIRRYFLNSEGTRISDVSEFFVLSAECQALAVDGMPIKNFYATYSRSLEDLKSQSEIHNEIEKMVKETLALREAPIIEPYTGPALLDASVCGVFFHEAIGHRLEGERQRAHDEGQTFTKKLGEKIIPEFLSVIDDPTMLRWENGDYLVGFYRYDDEGVKAQRVNLIEDGILKNFLLSRTPIKGFPNSNGHGRAASFQRPMGRMANTIVLSKNAYSWQELKEKLIEMTRQRGLPFGLIIKKATGGETATRKESIQAFRNSPILIYKVDAKTGEETLVRGAEIVGTPLVSINKIVATSNNYRVFNGMCGAESGFVPVATVAPDILVSEIELQKVSFKPNRPPILDPPMPATLPKGEGR